MPGLSVPGIESSAGRDITADGLPYYTMEWVEGSCIDDYCRTHVASVRGRVELLLQVASALNPRFYLHFTPTYSLWLNLVERFFAALTERQLLRRSFRSPVELEQAICRYLDQHNEKPKPIRWTKSADKINNGATGSLSYPT